MMRPVTAGRRSGTLVIAVGLLVFVLPLPAYPYSSLQPGLTRQLHFDQHPGASLPLSAQFRDSSGRSVRLSDFFSNKPVVLVLEYLRCRSLCGWVLRDTVHALSGVPLAAGRDYEVVAISIDPRDTTTDAAHTAREYFPNSGPSVPGWHFLTGDRSDIEAVSRAVGFPSRYDPKIDQYAHPAGVTIVTPAGTIARYLLGVGYRPLDIRLALSDAARGSISSPVADLLLLCYCYDPGTGRYSFAIGNVTRILCVATVIGLCVLIVRLMRNPREAP